MKKKQIKRHVSIVFYLFLTIGVCAQEKFTGIDEIIDTMYSVISGPAGERDWDLFRSLFHDQAIMGSVNPTPNGKTVFNHFEPEGYIKMNSPFFTKNGFFEDELKRDLKKFGNIAQVFTSYQFRIEEDGPIAQRGVNCVQLVKENGRWYITQLIWQPETADNKLNLDQG